MNDITVYARTHYVRLSVSEMAAEVKPAIPTTWRFSIFAFEGIWITPAEFLSLKQCTATRILVIAPEATVRFLSVLLDGDNISYAIINTELFRLKEKIKRFILQRYDVPVRKEAKRKSGIVITYSEYRLLMLYISGDSVNHIARRLGISVKRVYNMKTYAMSKMELFSDAALVNSWGIIERWLYTVPPLKSNSITRPSIKKVAS